MVKQLYTMMRKCEGKKLHEAYSIKIFMLGEMIAASVSFVCPLVELCEPCVMYSSLRSEKKKKKEKCIQN